MTGVRTELGPMGAAPVENVVKKNALARRNGKVQQANSSERAHPPHDSRGRKSRPRKGAQRASCDRKPSAGGIAAGAP